MTPTSKSDSELLANWLNRQSEAAFHELVARYAGLVQMTAKRACADDSMAAEAAQLTFITLARKAKSLTSCTSLGGWLHLTAMMQAKTLLRNNLRENRKRQLLQVAMETDIRHHSGDLWQEMQPVLDDALAALSARDREALLLRFYRSLSVREIAATLGIATDAAQKRIDRATDRLRGKLLRRGCQAGGSLSAVLLAGFAGDAHAAAPAVSLLASKAIAGGVVGSGVFSLTAAFLTASAMKTTSAVVSIVIVLAAGAWLAKQHMATSAPPMNGTSDNQIEPLATAAKKDPYAWFRSLIEANALKTGKSLTESAIDQINADKITKGTAEGTYNCVMHAFWNEPEVFLDSLKATAQGMELKFAIAAYLCNAGKEKSFDHFEKAYNTINPGGARMDVADSWVRVVGCEQGIDAAIAIITGFDFREEQVGAILALKQVIRQNGLEPNAEQGKQLELIKRSK